jgi:hypothetical protein
VAHVLKLALATVVGHLLGVSAERRQQRTALLEHACQVRLEERSFGGRIGRGAVAL